MFACRFTLVFAATLLAVQLAQAADAPKRKPGLWELKTSTTAAQGQVMTFQQCIDASTDDLLRSQGQEAAKERCSKNDIRVSGNSVSFESVCKIQNTTATTSGRFSGSFDSAYRGEMTTRYVPPMMGMSEARTTMEARWIGPCKAGQKPGDMIMPGLGNINTHDMMRGSAQTQEMMKNNPQMQEMIKQYQK